MLAIPVDLQSSGVDMSGRIEQAFHAAGAADSAAFIAYICAGDPTLESTVELAVALAEAGVDIIELGLPFSDPLADGVVNQAAAQRALEAGATTAGVFDAVRAIRRRNGVPLVLYTYLNPVYAFGFADFHAAASQAGLDGLLILDLPPDELARNAELAAGRGLDSIRLVAPTTPESRLPGIVAGGGGFIYYVSQTGVTGERSEVATSIDSGVAAIRRHTGLPVAVGFGISKPEHVRTVAAAADGVVVGSAIVRQIERHGADPRLPRLVADFVRPLAAAKSRAASV